MPRAIGANSRRLVIPEATYGTAPGGNWKQLPFLSCDLGAEQPLLDADVIGLGGNRDTAAPFLDTVTVAGSAVVPVDLVNIGHWLQLLFGPPATTGTAPNFTHTFGSGAATLPSNSAEVGYPDVPSYDLCTGVRADTLEIDFSPSGAATATFGLMGQGSVRGTTSAGGTPTTAAYAAFNKAQGSISRGGSALAQVTGRQADPLQRRGDGLDHPRRPQGGGPGPGHRPRRRPGHGALRRHRAADPGAERAVSRL